MAAQEGNGPASQVKIHLTTRDQNIQLPQDTGSILVATGKYLKKYTCICGCYNQSALSGFCYFDPFMLTIFS